MIQHYDAAHDTSVISKQNLLLEFCADPKSRDEMQAYIDVSSRSHFSKYYLKPLLSSGKLGNDVSRQTQKQNQKYTTVHSNNQEAGHWVSSPIVPLLSFQIYSHHLPIHPIHPQKYPRIALSVVLFLTTKAVLTPFLPVVPYLTTKNWVKSSRLVK